MTDGPPKTTDAAVQTTASGECGFTLPSQPAKVVHGTQAYNDELIEAWRSSQRSCVISCPSRTSSGRLAIFTNTRRSPTREQDAQSTAAAASALPLRLSAWRAHGTGLPAEHDVVSLGLKSLSVNPPPQPGSRPEFEAHHSHSAAANRLFRDANRGPAETLHVHVYPA